jgi:SpoIID/LytB domain protein
MGRARRRWWIVVVATLLVTTVLGDPGAARAAEDDDVVFTGAGWGHGVGMAQWGTQARANDGQTHAAILSAYYTGSTLGTLGQGGVAAVGKIFVNIASDQITTKATVVAGPGGGGSGVSVTRGGNEPVTLQNGQSLTVVDTNDNNPGGCRVDFSHHDDWDVGGCNIDIALTEGGGPPAHLVKIESCRLSGDRCTYGWGKQIHFVDNAVHDPGFPGFDVVVEVGIDDYVRGITEVPFSWHMEALETQAIAARSYAASRAVDLTHTATGCWCELRNDSFDQVYSGWVLGWPDSSRWDQAATGTAGTVVTHPAAPDGMIVRAYYSSSNGGASESSQEKWGGSHPYLVSVPDPWSLEAPNPNRSWNVAKTNGEVAAWLGMTGVQGAQVTARNTSGSPKTFLFTGFDAAGNTKEVSRSVEQVRSRFALNSWFFEIVIGSSSPGLGDRVGLHDPTTGIWHLQRPNGTVSSFYYGNPKDIPYAGDWNGDGVITMGLYRQSTGFLFLRNSNTQGIADIEIFYGNPGDIPIAGDWNGDGVDTVGIFRPSEARFYLRNTNTQGVGDVSFAFGDRGDIPIAGDWDGDGKDTVGLYRPSTRTVYLANSISNPGADFTWVYTGAIADDRIVAGDWNRNGIDTVGIFRPSEGRFYLRDTFTQAAANIVFDLGASYMTPVAGWWGD